MRIFGLAIIMFLFGCSSPVDDPSHAEPTAQISQAGGGGSIQYCDGQIFISLYLNIREETVGALCGPNAALQSWQTASCTPPVTASQVEQLPYPFIAPMGREAILSTTLNGNCWRMERAGPGVPLHHTYAVNWSRHRLASFLDINGYQVRGDGIRSFTGWDVEPGYSWWTYTRNDTWNHWGFILRGDYTSIIDQFELSRANCSLTGFGESLPGFCQAQNTTYWNNYSATGSASIKPTVRFVACDAEDGWWTRARLIASEGYNRSPAGSSQAYYADSVSFWTYLGLVGVNTSTIQYGRLNDVNLTPLN